MCLNNGDLLRAFKKKRGIQLEMKLNSVRETSAKFATYSKRLAAVDLEIAKLAESRSYGASRVFVIFNSESSWRNCLKAMCLGSIPAAFDQRSAIDPKFIFRGNVLSVREAPEVNCTHS